jgi:hypothetical protein
MGVLADWKRKRRFAKVIEWQNEQQQRELILEWYKLLKPFDRLYSIDRDKLLGALADDLSRNAVSDVVWTFIWFGGAWTVILALLFLFGGWEQRQIAIWLALPGFIGILILAFKTMKREMRNHLERLAEGYWVANDPFTGKEVYKVMKCPKCNSGHNVNAYLRYLEPCKYCGHNIDWEAAKLS